MLRYIHSVSCWDQEVSGHMMSCDVHMYHLLCNRAITGRGQSFLTEVRPLVLRVLFVMGTVGPSIVWLLV